MVITGTTLELAIKEPYKAHHALSMAYRALANPSQSRRGAGNYKYALADFWLKANSPNGWNVGIRGEIGSRITITDDKEVADCCVQTVRGISPSGKFIHRQPVEAYLTIVTSTSGNYWAKIVLVDFSLDSSMI